MTLCPRGKRQVREEGGRGERREEGGGLAGDPRIPKRASPSFEYVLAFAHVPCATPPRSTVGRRSCVAWMASCGGHGVCPGAPCVFGRTKAEAQPLAFLEQASGGSLPKLPLKHNHSTFPLHRHAHTQAHLTVHKRGEEGAGVARAMAGGRRPSPRAFFVALPLHLTKHEDEHPGRWHRPPPRPPRATTHTLSLPTATGVTQGGQCRRGAGRACPPHFLRRNDQPRNLPT